MNRTGNYDVTPRNRAEEREQRREKSMAANTTEYYTMNAIATLLALAALAMFVVGMLIGTGIIDTSSTTAVTTGGGNFDGTNFAHGTVWLLGAISTALAANVFRRAHSTVDPTELENRSGYNQR